MRASRPALVLEALAGAVRATGIALDADRCWLYARDPETREGVALVRWARERGVPDVPEGLWTWSPEPPDLGRTDPLFGRALTGAPCDVIADTERADVDPAMERALGHRAFVHLNLHAGGTLAGVLQPGMTGAPRDWTEGERDALLALRPALAPLVAAAVRDRPASVALVG